MKKLLAIILSASMLFAFASCSGGETAEIEYVSTYSKDLAGTTLNVFNWGEYISDGSEGTLDVNKAFEDLTGINVEYTTFDSNEAMYGKIKKEGGVTFDIIIPSDYMIQRMISEDMLLEFDTSEIENYKYIDEKYKNLYFDEQNKYSVPYNVGMVGLIYNKTMVDSEPTSWSVMWDEKYKNNILNFNNPRDAFAIAQFLLGIDINTDNQAEWQAAATKLKEQKPLLQSYVMDEIYDKMEGGQAAIAPYYAGDCMQMIDSNPDLAFVYPKEGTNIFVDSICIPKTAQNVEAAKMYINFLLEPEIALANAERLCYASPNTAVVNNDEYSYKGNEILYPAPENTPKTEYFHDLDPTVRSYYESLWTEIKNS